MSSFYGNGGGSNNGPDSKFDLSDRIAKGVDDNGNVIQGAIIEGVVEDTTITIPEQDESFTIPSNVASGTFSHAEGEGTTASGEGSHAEGSGTTASGICSHAEGEGIIASGEGSHAEGGATTASGQSSHAEGAITTASGECSHAEGNYTTASGYTSHAEGFRTTASGYTSHAEGEGTTASAYASHTEGQGTIAKNRSQHVFGEYNIEDPSSNASNQRGTYVEIVGNGTRDDTRSNARTLDWSGNERLAGSLTLGLGTADESTITAAQLKQLLTLESNVESLLAAI